MQNIFEAKVRGRGDTAEARKVKLLDNLSFNGSYNLVADSLKLSNINMAARTRLFDVVDFNFSGTLDPYVYQANVDRNGNLQQRRIDRYLWEDGRGIGQLSNANISISTNLTPKSFRKATEQKAASLDENTPIGH
ncbi:MAG: hypothetical protein HC880_09320 [Bacteroidia bacterium]|nr:hypothetical protein [Bacteroidia bacterium]